VSQPTVLLLTPLKDAADCLDGYVERVLALTYPHERLSLGFLESDSRDGTWASLQAWLPTLRGAFRRVGAWRRDFGYRLPEGVHRGAEPIQLERRTVLARSRNHLLFHALDDEEWVLWLDVDVVEYPRDLIERLLATGKEIVQPHCVLRSGGPTFDTNGWRDHGRWHLDDLRIEGELVELDAVGGTALLVRGDVHRDGLLFPAFPYGVPNPRVRPGRGEVETEGLGMMALDMGVQPWGMPHLEIRHRDEAAAGRPGAADDRYAELHRQQDAAIAAIPPYPTERFRGDGIVIVAGRPWYFTNAFVALWVLRRVLGCDLPAQLWYLGRSEMSREMIALAEGTFEGVACVDATGIAREQPARRLGGWEAKSFALLHSPFERVLLLDADNVPLVDPTELFAHPELRRTGALFWPDIDSIPPASEIWAACRVPYRDEPAFESGQMVVDKARCWRELQLTRHLNDHSDVYYRFINGDKDTFHLAWRMLGAPYAMPPIRPTALRDDEESHRRRGWAEALILALLQHDFDGRPLFSHRVGAKWAAWGHNVELPGVPFHAACVEALGYLRERWSGEVAPPPRAIRTDSPRSAAEVAALRRFLYRRKGADERLLELLPDGSIGQGAAYFERRWRFEPAETAAPRLTLLGDGLGAAALTCTLSWEPDGIWRGRWIDYERMPVELIPLGPAAVGG
jgi:hypothetical protein